mmetsp:Transcript_55550/g.121024  ORF Transcript_55550/g.121024 Transcript_55550/m.121024 type:complete len:101 (+) Transcript_55550:65-367(+)
MASRRAQTHRSHFAESGTTAPSMKLEYRAISQEYADDASTGKAHFTMEAMAEGCPVWSTAVDAFPVPQVMRCLSFALLCCGIYYIWWSNFGDTSNKPKQQ